MRQILIFCVHRMERGTSTVWGHRISLGVVGARGHDKVSARKWLVGAGLPLFHSFHLFNVPRYERYPKHFNEVLSYQGKINKIDDLTALKPLYR